MSAATAPAPQPIDLSAAAASLRVSLRDEYGREVWQGTVGELCANWNRNEPRPTPREIVAAIAAQKEGSDVFVGSLPEQWFLLDMRSPNRVLRLKRAHYYQDQKTGSLYTDGANLRAAASHWDRRGPIRATLGQTEQRRPLVTISNGFGFDGDYTPGQIRAYAQTLLKIADDAEAQPMGPRSFHRSVRGYDIEVGLSERHALRLLKVLKEITDLAERYGVGNDCDGNIIEAREVIAAAEGRA